MYTISTIAICVINVMKQLQWNLNVLLLSFSITDRPLSFGITPLGDAESLLTRFSGEVKYLVYNYTNERILKKTFFFTQ